MGEKERSPFSPGLPVPHDMFVGREMEIEELLRWAREAKSGKAQNVFLIGDRGIGKSSLAAFMCDILKSREALLSVHVFPSGSVSLKEVVRLVFDQLLRQARTEAWLDEIKSLFGKHIRELGLFGITLTFAPSDEDLQELVRSFPEALYNLWQKVKSRKKGMFIVLDNLNSLVQDEVFANWYKSFADETATKYPDFPVFTMLVGLPEQRKRLAEQQPSLMRIFKIVDIEKLSDGEVNNFLGEAFTKASMKVESEALDVMVRYSSGLPVLMQEIGDAVFWLDTDGTVSVDDAWRGIFQAASVVGKKYLDSRVYEALRSENYKSILRTLGKNKILREFTKKEAEKGLTEAQQKVLHNFLQKMISLGVIERDTEKPRGHYRFVNELYPVYIWLQAESSRKSR